MVETNLEQFTPRWGLLTCEADLDRALKLDPCNSRALEQKAM